MNPLFNFYFTGLASILVIVIGFCFFAYLRYKQAQLQIKLLHKHQVALHHVVHLLVKADLGMGAHIAEMEKSLANLDEVDVHMDGGHTTSPSAYNQAMKLLELGTDINSVIAVSGLSRAEAELMQRLKFTQNNH